MAKEKKNEAVAEAVVESTDKTDSTATDRELLEAMQEELLALRKENEANKEKLSAMETSIPAPKVRKKKNYAKGEELVKLYIPSYENGGEDDVYLSVNGENIVIQRNEEVWVKPKFYNAWLDSQEQQAASLKYKRANKFKEAK